MTSSRAVGRVFDTEDTETQRTQRNFVISHQRLYRPRTVEFAVLRLRRVHQDRRAAFLSTSSQTTQRALGLLGICKNDRDSWGPRGGHGSGAGPSPVPDV